MERLAFIRTCVRKTEGILGPVPILGYLKVKMSQEEPKLAESDQQVVQVDLTFTMP